ncbi:MAG: hypothetical protein ABI039_07330 [Vicinamibacterales bacterium]
MRAFRHGDGQPVMATITNWADAMAAAPRILLIVNSHAGAENEISQALDAIERHVPWSRVAAIVPAALLGELARRGVAARSIMPHELEVGFAMQSDRVLQWAIRQRADLIVGSEPYLPDNEEVKTQFELRVAPMLGQARLLAHSLPLDHALLLSSQDLWRRAAHAEDVAEHRTRVQDTLEHLHAAWSRDPHTPLDQAQAMAAGGLAVPPVASSELPPSMMAAWQWSYLRLHDALRSDGGYPPAAVRMITDPAGAVPAGGWIGGRVDAIRRPVQLAAGLRRHGPGLSFRGRASEPYAYLLMSRFVNLEPGDAAVAEGRVHHGGVTIGLVKGDQWASRVDVVDRGRFMAAAVATTRGPHALVVAHCLHGADRRSALAIRRVGFRRAEN